MQTLALKHFRWGKAPSDALETLALIARRKHARLGDRKVRRECLLAIGAVVMVVRVLGSGRVADPRLALQQIQTQFALLRHHQTGVFAAMGLHEARKADLILIGIQIYFVADHDICDL